MISPVNLTDVRSFILVTQLGNYTKTAEALNVSRSHVSRQIKALEQEIGVTLFVRTTRTLKLTQAGKRFYQACVGAFDSIDQAVLAAMDDVDEVKGEIRVNCVGGYIGEDIIAPILIEFMNAYPQIKVHLDFSSHRVDLIEEEFDIAFRMGALDDSGFIAQKLLTLPMATLASPNYLANHGKPNHPKILAEHRCITGSVKRWSFLHKPSNQEYVVNVNGSLQCKNGRTLVNAALMHQGIIRVPVLYCQNELEQGHLVEVFDDWYIPSVDFSMLYHKDKYQPKRIRTLLDFVKSALLSKT